MVDFLETDLVTEDILVQVPLYRVAVAVLVVEWLPYVLPPVCEDPHDRPGTCVQPAFVDLVDRDIGEQGRVGRNPAGCQPPRGRHE